MAIGPRGHPGGASARRVVVAGVVAVVLVGCGPVGGDPDGATSPGPDRSGLSTSPTESGPTPGVTGDVRPPLSARPVDVDPPEGPELAALVTELSDLEIVLLREAQQATDQDQVRQIGARRHVGDGLVAFTEFATAMLAGVDLPDEPLPVSNVEVLAQGPGCVVARHVRGDQPPVTERLVATGTRDAPAWRVERTLTADQFDPDRACPRR